jgi:hypothetical protein
MKDRGEMEGCPVGLKPEKKTIFPTFSIGRPLRIAGLADGKNKKNNACERVRTG